MARKSESISDKIVRMYKEGYYIEEIAKTLEMPKDNVPKILEKHMPDFETFVQPEITHETESDKGKKGMGSVLSTPVGSLFKRKTKKADENEVDVSKVSVNLTMDENGFVDRTVASIASMLQKGKTASEMAGFFSKNIADIKAIENVMGEHFARIESAEKAEDETSPVAQETPEKPAYSRANVFTSGLEVPTTAKPTYSKRDEPVPVSKSYGLATDTTPEPVPAEPVSAPVAEEYHEPVYVEPASYIEPEFKGHEQEEEIPEMPSIDPISLDDLDKELSKKEPEPTPEIPAIGGNIDTDMVNNFTKDGDLEMSPMEKMKKFAEEQIALNNQKIEELQSKKIDAENKAFDSNTKVTNVQKQIEDLQLQLASLESEKAQAAEIVTSINEEIESINKESAEFSSYIAQ